MREERRCHNCYEKHQILIEVTIDSAFYTQDADSVVDSVKLCMRCLKELSTPTKENQNE